MAFNYKNRKLIGDLVNTTISEGCGYFCGSTQITGGICPDSCIQDCPLICRPPDNGTPIPPFPFLPTSLDDHPVKKSHKLPFALTISLSIFASAFVLFCCYTFYRLYLNLNRSRRSPQTQEEEDNGHDDFVDENHGPLMDHPIWYIRTVGLQPSAIDAISVCKYKRGDGLVEGTECSVCLNEFQEDETLRLLPKCNHAFHIPCIDTWLRSRTNCPVCRAGIVSDTASLTTSELGVGGHSGHVEGTQVGVGMPENLVEFERVGEDEAAEIRIDLEGEGQLTVGNEIKGHEIKPMRRSVSVDFLSAPILSAATASANQGQSNESSDGIRNSVKVNESNSISVPKTAGGNQCLLRLKGSYSMGRSLQRGHTSLRRSSSCSSKVVQSRHNSSHG